MYLSTNQGADIPRNSQQSRVFSGVGIPGMTPLGSGNEDGHQQKYQGQGCGRMKVPQNVTGIARESVKEEERDKCMAVSRPKTRILSAYEDMRQGTV